MTPTSTAERLWRRVQNVVGWGRTTGPAIDTGTAHMVQHKTNDITVRDNVPVVFHFGFAACLPVGTDTVTVHVAGSSSNGVIVATNHQPSRPTGLQSGEAMLYNEAGDHVYMRADRSIEVKSALKIVLDTPMVELTGGLTAVGDVVAGPNLVSLVNHVQTDVQRGGGVSGPPQ